MSAIIEIRDNGTLTYQEYYGVTWEVTSLCNFKCRYCTLNKDEPFNDPDKTINFLNDLNKRFPVSVTLFGGEPTEHPKILDIIKNLECGIQLFTNMSKPLSFYEKVLDIKPATFLETTYHNDRKNFEEFFEKVRALSKRARVTVYLMLDSNYSNYRALYGQLSTLNVAVSVLRVYADDQKELSEEDEIWFKGVNRGDSIIVTNEDHTERHTSVGYVYANSLNNFKFWKCLCGKRNMYISSLGLCYPCLDYKKKGLSFFDINNPDQKNLETILSTGTVCVMDECTSEISTPKKRIFSKKHG